MIEIEKKYKLTKEQFDTLRTHLQSRSFFVWKDVEENILFELEDVDNVLRFRNVKNFYKNKVKSSVLTFKGKATVENGIKSRVEIETDVDSEVLNILTLSGLKRKIVYEKIRETFHSVHPLKADICLDELPFGYYMEIEGTEESIKEVEKTLPFTYDVENLSYPALTQIYGKSVNTAVEARFA